MNNPFARARLLSYRKDRRIDAALTAGACGIALGMLLLLNLPLGGAADAQGQNPPTAPGGYAGHHRPHPANGAAPPSPVPAVPPASAPHPGLNPAVQPKKTSAGEEFFIVASVDQTKSQILLKEPSEVTQLMAVDGKTQIADENGKPLKLSDLRAGDTVWVTSSRSGSELSALRIRKGQMSVADLHRYYLDYPEIK